MKSIFDYLDYREPLKDAFEARKASNPLFTYRQLAAELGLHISNTFRILHKDAHLPMRCQSRAIEFLGLKDREATYFMLLLAYARETNAKSRQEILERALSLRDVSRRELEEDELAYYGHWWIPALRSLLEITNGKSVPAELAARLDPPVDEKDVERALKLLLELGLIKKASSGRLIPAEHHVSAKATPRKAKAVGEYQAQVLALASESLARFPSKTRDVSTITMSVNAKSYAEIRSMLKECRRLIQKIAHESTEPDRTMQLAMAFFPLTKTEDPR